MTDLKLGGSGVAFDNMMEDALKGPNGCTVVFFSCATGGAAKGLNQPF